jgi:hypothetical protein
LKFAAAWLQEPLFDVPAIQNAFWTLLWLIPEVAPELLPPFGSDPDAAETALPLLKFTANWLHEKLFDVPAVQVALWVFDWLIEDVALALVLGLVCANAAFDVVATTRNAAITADTMVNNFVVLMFLTRTFSTVYLYIKMYLYSSSMSFALSC